MASPLRDVLNAFEDRGTALSLKQLARQLDISEGMLEMMIGHWVKKGRLREVSNPDNCQTCGGASGCPFIMQMPRMYELVRESDTQTPENLYDCGGCGCS